MKRRDFVVINATVSKYDNVFDFHEDMGMVLYNSKYGFINKEGVEVVKTIYDDAKDYSNNYAAVKRNNLWFFINKKGYKVSLEYDFVQSFQNGYAIVKKNNKWGVIDTNFKEVIPTIYDTIDSISEGLVLVSKNGIIKYLDLNNEVKIELPKTIKRAYAFKNGIARIENYDYKTAYMDLNGKLVTDFIYIAGSDFNERFASVTTKEGSTIVHRSGKELFPITNDFNINNSLSNGNFEASLAYKKNALINHLGALITKKTYTHMYYESEGLIRVQDENNNYGFIDINGNEIIPTKLDYADDFSEGLSVVRDSKTMKYGYMDRYGILVIPYIYDTARNFSNDMAIVSLNGNSFYIDKNNNPLKVKETKRQIIKVEAPGNIPSFVINYDITKDFLRYRTELSVSPEWTPRVIETKDMDKVNEHEDKVLKMETEIITSMEELTNKKVLRK